MQRHEIPWVDGITQNDYNRLVVFMDSIVAAPLVAMRSTKVQLLRSMSPELKKIIEAFCNSLMPDHLNDNEILNQLSKTHRLESVRMALRAALVCHGKFKA